MNTRDAIMAAILANPAEDLPRLALADHLEDEEPRDPERSAFIRLGVELAQQPNCEWVQKGRVRCDNLIGVKCRPCALRERERAALQRHGTEWSEPIAKLLGCDTWNHNIGMTPGHRSGIVTFEWDWSRGFIDSITLPWADFARCADSILWRPGATMECARCGGHGLVQHWDNPHQRNWHCPAKCEDGRVPRPMPASAQPISAVVLTTWPEVETAELPCEDSWLRGDPGHRFDSATLGAQIRVEQERAGVTESRYPREFGLPAILHLRWPGITFTLPAAVRPWNEAELLQDMASDDMHTRRRR